MEQFFTGIFSRLSEEFNPETLGGTFAVLLSNLIVGILTFLAFYHSGSYSTDWRISFSKTPTSMKPLKPL